MLHWVGKNFVPLVNSAASCERAGFGGSLLAIPGGILVISGMGGIINEWN